MLTTGTLTTLIKSLSKSEKRYFKLFCSMQQGNKGYWYLYELISKEKASEPLKTSFARQYPMASFDTARKHLYRMLMKSLRSYGSESTVENQLLRIVQDVKILFERGLTALCFAQLDKGKALALHYEQFYYFLILGRLELQYLAYLEFPSLSEAEVVGKQEKLHQVTEQVQLIDRHTALYDILFYRYLHRGINRHEQQRERLNDLLLEEHQVNTYPMARSFASERVHLLFQSVYFLISGEGEESLALFYELNTLFEQHPRLWQDDPIYYLYLINGILAALRAIEQYEAMTFFMVRLESIGQQSPPLRELTRTLLYQHRLARLIDQRQWAAGVVMAEAYGQDSPAKPLISNIGTTICFQSAAVYFGAGQFQQALRYINRVLNSSSTYVSDYLYVLCRLLNLLIHLELDHEQYLTYEIRSLNRKLKAERKLHRVEQEVLGFLKQWIKGGDRKALLLSFQGDLGAMEDAYDRQLLRLLDLPHWVANKISLISG